jgi:outer membrane receptor protein involved in Fe transport
VFQLGYVNLPTARIKGLEMEFAITASDMVQFDGSLAWNDAKTDGASTLAVTDENGETFSFSVEDGARLPLTPDYTLSLGVEIRPHAVWLGAKPFVRYDYSYVGASLNSLSGIESVVSGNPVQKQDSYQIGNLRFGLEADRWTGSVYVDNLTDERANLFLNNRWKVQRESVNRPRTIGVQLHYKF